MVEPRRYIPVDKPHIIARRILPHFPESHAPAFKRAVVFARKKVPREPFAFDF